MRKLFACCAVAISLMTTNALAADVMLANFESGDDNLVYNSDLWTNNEFDLLPLEIRSNSVTDGMNVTLKSMTVKNKENAGWWPNYNGLKLITPITITEENKFLKMLVYREVQVADIKISFNVDNNNDTGKRVIFEGVVSKTGAWVDLVIDLSAYVGQEFKFLSIVHSNNWENKACPEATYMYDEFVLSDNNIPRTETIALVADKLILGSFENPEADLLTIGGWSNYPTSIVDNEITDGINTTAKTLSAINVGDVNWWGNFLFLDLATPITIKSDMKFLKMMVNRSAQPRAFRVLVNAMEDANIIYEGKVSEDGIWQDIVIDMTKFVDKEISQLIFVHSANFGDSDTAYDGQTIKYMYDEIELSKDNLPRVKIIEPTGTEFALASFEDTDSDLILFNPNFWNEPAVFVTPVAVGDNTVVDGINDTQKAVLVNNIASADWWGNFSGFIAKDPIRITSELQYLKMMIYRENQPCNLRISLGNNRDVNILFEGKLTRAGVWEDVVLDLSPYIGGVISEINFVHSTNWEDPKPQSPITRYMYDELILSDNDIPRTNIPTGAISSNKEEMFRVESLTKAIRLTTDNSVQIAIYSVQGALLKRVALNGNMAIDMQSGVYFVVGTDASGYTQRSKVRVQ